MLRRSIHYCFLNSSNCVITVCVPLCMKCNELPCIACEMHCVCLYCRTVKPVTVNHGMHMPSWYSHCTSHLLVYSAVVLTR